MMMARVFRAARAAFRIHRAGNGAVQRGQVATHPALRSEARPITHSEIRSALGVAGVQPANIEWWEQTCFAVAIMGVVTEQNEARNDVWIVPADSGAAQCVTDGATPALARRERLALLGADHAANSGC